MQVLEKWAVSFIISWTAHKLNSFDNENFLEYPETPSGHDLCQSGHNL